MGRLVNQGLWWCGLKDKSGRQKHPHCDCENCKDYEDNTGYIMSYTTNDGITYITDKEWSI